MHWSPCLHQSEKCYHPLIQCTTSFCLFLSRWVWPHLERDRSFLIEHFCKLLCQNVSSGFNFFILIVTHFYFIMIKWNFLKVKSRFTNIHPTKYFKYFHSPNFSWKFFLLKCQYFTITMETMKMLSGKVRGKKGSFPLNTVMESQWISVDLKVKFSHFSSACDCSGEDCYLLHDSWYSRWYQKAINNDAIQEETNT